MSKDMTSEPTSAPKQGRIRKGWEMAKSAWRVFKLDKELMSLPLLGLLVTIVALVPFGLIALAVIYNSSSVDGASIGFDLGYWTVPFWLSVYFVVTLVSNFFAGAVIHGAMTRFRGGDPTVKGSLAAMRHKFRPLAMFSLLMATVGLIFQLVKDRVPFAGRIAVWLLDAAWNIANFFALPIIVMSDGEVRPLQATKQSVQLVKQVWGEGVVAAGGIAIISALTILGYMLLSGAVAGLLAIAGLLPVGVALLLIPLFILGLLAIILVTSVLDGVIKAALYHYATTGEAPATFNKQLLRSAMTPKKARRIFGSAR